MRCRAVANRRLRRCFVLIIVGLALRVHYPQEPGLFGHDRAPRRSAERLRGSDRDPPGNRDLPVVGDAVWTSGDGLDITVRLAVHAVRRMPAERSSTGRSPLSGPDLGPDEPYRSTSGSPVSVKAIPMSPARVPRSGLPPVDPSRPGLQSCLCTPVWLVQRELRIGHTTLLQTAYPALPECSPSTSTSPPCRSSLGCRSHRPEWCRSSGTPPISARPPGAGGGRHV